MSAPAIAAAGAAVLGVAAVVSVERAGVLTPAGVAAVSGQGRSRLRAGLRALGGAVHVATGLAAALVALLLVAPVPAGLIGLLAGVGSVAHARRRVRQHGRACEHGTPALARSLSDALRGGASIRTALGEAAADRSVGPVLRGELAQAASAIGLGTAVEPALAGLARCGGSGLRLACGTIALHLEAGGALASALERVAIDGEAALRVEEERLAATAQARATVRVVAALPILALLGAELTSGHFVAGIVAKPLACGLLIAGVLLELLAVIAARAIVGSRA